MAKEIIQCTYKGQAVRIFTCLSPEQAEELRGRWPDGVVVIDRLRETPPLRDENARTWLIKTVCQILKIKDWQTVDRECTGRTEYAAPRDFSREPVPLMKSALTEVALPAQRARKRVSRVERMRGAARAAIPRNNTGS